MKLDGEAGTETHVPAGFHGTHGRAPLSVGGDIHDSADRFGRNALGIALHGRGLAAAGNENAQQTETGESSVPISTRLPG